MTQLVAEIWESLETRQLEREQEFSEHLELIQSSSSRGEVPSDVRYEASSRMLLIDVSDLE